MSLYGLIIGISIIIGINYFEKHSPIISLRNNYYFFTGILVSAIVGARAYHVFDYWDYYSANTTAILKTWNGGLGIFGGLFGGLLFIFIYSSLHKLNLLKVLSGITPILPLCQAIGRIGNFVNREISTWWIEALMNLGLFILIRKKFLHRPTSAYLIGYGLIRLITEVLRNDTWQINSLKIGQLISILLILIGVIISSHENQKIVN